MRALALLLALAPVSHAYYQCTASRECADAYGAPVSGSESTLNA